MNAPRATSHAVRRARPLLGTLVEAGVCGAAQHDAWRACEAAFDAMAQVQRALSRFDPASDIARFNALDAGQSIDVGDDTAFVLSAARQLFVDSDGVFDVSLGHGTGWTLDAHRLHKLQRDTVIDLGGIGKGHAVDRAVRALLHTGGTAGWVNAGGDLRSFGDARVAIHLRDEQRGGVVAFGHLHDGAFATSCFDSDARSQLWRARPARLARAHVSVAAPSCLMADALTKVVAASGDLQHPLLACAGAQAWLH